jgi:capsular exopolysaccharide synthesis family protein
MQKGIFKDKSLVVQNIQNHLDSIRPSVIKSQLQAIDAASKFYKDQLSTYKLAIDNLKNEFVVQPDIIKGFEDIQQKVEINDEKFLSLVKAKEVFRLKIAQKTAPWTLISPPRMYSKPTGPNILKYLFYGTFISISFGGLITYIRDRLDNVYHDPATIIDNVGSISLGLIPYISFFEGIREQKKFILKNLDKQIEDNNLNNDKESLTANNDKNISSYQRFFYQEAFRNILTSLRFLESDKEINVITITSSIPAEGKTLVNILLAKTYSELDKKVLLIDGDMRKPQLHYRLGMNNILGLSNILTDSSLNVSKVIKKVEGYENWDVITSGFIPPDPTRLLGSDRMNEFISTLRNLKTYDIVIFDCPPVIGLADASLIAEKTDGMILLVSLEKVPVGLPLEAKRIMKNCGAEFLGIIINSMKENKNLLTNKSYGYTDIYAQYAEEENLSEELTSNQILLNKIKDFLKKFVIWLDN